MMILKIKTKSFGGHYHCKVFSGPDKDQTFAKLGELVIDGKDYESLKNGVYEIVFEEQEGGGDEV